MSEKKKSSKESKGKDKSVSKSSSKTKLKSKDLTEESKSIKEPTTTFETSNIDHSKGKDVNASLDFEAGVVFNKYDKKQSGVISAKDFLHFWRESNIKREQTTNNQSEGPKYKPGEISSFEAGSIFAKYDKNNDGRLDKQEFEEMIIAHPELDPGFLHSHSPPQQTSNNAYYNISENIPMNYLTSNMQTHYDETAGVAIPRSSVHTHESMGNIVKPLVESYQARFTKLRSILSGKLLPRREHLLQLRRQLQNSSTEIEATRRNIERETISDTDRIIERLRNVESMRQSAVHHQVLLVDEDLDCIDRLIKRVEVANGESSLHGPTGVSIKSSSIGPSAYQPSEAMSPSRASLMVELIQQYGDLCASIERQANKPISIQVDFPTDDFPKETSERLDIISRCDKYSHALSVKDHMLWKAIQEKEKTEEMLEMERKLSYEYAQELSKWADMSQSLQENLKELKNENENLQHINMQYMNLLRDNNIFFSHLG